MAILTTTDQGLSYSGSSAFIKTGSDTVMTLTTSGNVGIGTTSPNANLHVYNTGNGEIEVERASGALINIQAQSAKGVIGTDTNHTLSLKTNASERLVILNTGNVGVGVTSPVSKLHVYQNGTETSTTAGITIEQDGAGDAQLQFLLTGLSRRVIGIDHSDGDKFKIGRGSDWGTGTDITIDSSGNVGIGTTAPDKQLHVYGSAPFIRIEENSSSEKRLDLWVDPSTAISYVGANQSASQLSFQTANTDRIRITNAGNVGIGTTSPTKKLHVNGDVKIDNGGILLQQAYGVNLGVSGYDLYMPSTTRIAFQTASTERLSILNNGNVGIGTTSPSTELDVAGDISADGVITTGGTATAEVGSWLHVGRQWSFSGLPYFNKTTGSTAQRLDGAFMTDLNTGTAASRRAQAVFGAAFNDISGYSGAGTDYSRALGASIKAGFFITGQDSAKVIFAVGLASTSGVYADADPISNYGFGVEFRRGSGSVYEWRVFGHNGTTLTASSWSSSGITYSTDPRTIAIYSDGSGNITAYTAMYGDTNYTTITTTGGPTATSGTSTSTNLVGLRCNTNASGYVTGAYAKARASAVNFYAE